MKFTIAQNQGGLTRTIDVAIQSETPIARVDVKYDGFEFFGLPENLNPPVISYNRTFTKTEGISPGLEHRVIVTATDIAGKSESATKVWKD